MANQTELRALVANVCLPTGERRNAATLLVRLLAAEVPTPADDDVEVLEAMKPLPRENPQYGEFQSIWDGWLRACREMGVAVDGRSLDDAKAAVLKKRQHARLKELRDDRTQDQFVRDAATAELNTQGAALRRRLAETQARVFAT